ncbi:hypothetical protein Anapl_00420 [Anas platyrhynchos]|uniref:Uncharacterized protein n=1 Tax=Anas platyrhynchos TaxID=8839 RepID=R0LKV7_ANAPL|nr:hypothetical protein Anapl_00420 [Anas platyrhynchos]
MNVPFVDIHFSVSFLPGQFQSEHNGSKHFDAWKQPMKPPARRARPRYCSEPFGTENFRSVFCSDTFRERANKRRKTEVKTRKKADFSLQTEHYKRRMWSAHCTGRRALSSRLCRGVPKTCRGHPESKAATSGPQHKAPIPPDPADLQLEMPLRKFSKDCGAAHQKVHGYWKYEKSYDAERKAEITAEYSNNPMQPLSVISSGQIPQENQRRIGFFVLFLALSSPPPITAPSLYRSHRACSDLMWIPDLMYSTALPGLNRAAFCFCKMLHGKSSNIHETVMLKLLTEFSVLTLKDFVHPMRKTNPSSCPFSSNGKIFNLKTVQVTKYYYSILKNMDTCSSADGRRKALEATALSFTALCMLVQWRPSQSTTGSRTTGSPGGHAEVGDELGHQEPTRENGWRCLELGAAWGWAGLMVPRQLPQAQAFSMSAKEENAKKKSTKRTSAYTLEMPRFGGRQQRLLKRVCMEDEQSPSQSLNRQQLSPCPSIPHPINRPSIKYNPSLLKMRGSAENGQTLAAWVCSSQAAREPSERCYRSPRALEAHRECTMRVFTS